MAEQRDDGQAGAEPGTDIQPTGPAQPAVPSPEPARLDAEQLRQFQQFQQFQDYLKFTEAQQQGQGGAVVPAQSQQPASQQNWQAPAPVPAPSELVPAERRPRKKAPRWLRWIGRKVLGWLIAILLLAIAATWAYNHFFPSDDAQTSAEVAAHGGGTYHTNQILPNSPHGAVHAIYDLIGKPIPDPEKRAELVCGSMTAEAQQQFANDVNSPDCRQATIDLNAKVERAQLNKYIYAVPAAATDPLGNRVTIYSCWYAISGGPSLGTFVVELREKGQWLIVGHAKDPAQCPPKPTDPTTTPTR